MNNTYINKPYTPGCKIGLAYMHCSSLWSDCVPVAPKFRVAAMINLEIQVYAPNRWDKLCSVSIWPWHMGGKWLSIYLLGLFCFWRHLHKVRLLCLSRGHPFLHITVEDHFSNSAFPVFSLLGYSTPSNFTWSSFKLTQKNDFQKRSQFTELLPSSPCRPEDREVWMALCLPTPLLGSTCPAAVSHTTTGKRLNIYTSHLLNL